MRPDHHAALPPSRFLLAEEQGLISVILQPSALAGEVAPKGCRLRMRPASKELREDDHVIDLEASLARVEEKVVRAVVEAEPGAVWTDTVVGHGRVTVGFGLRGRGAFERVVEASSRLNVGWELEEVVPDSTSKRIRELRKRGPEADDAKAPALAARLAAALEGAKIEGSFRDIAGLDGPRLQLPRVKKALSWLAAALPAADPAFRKVLGTAAEDAQLCVLVNAHPRLRQFQFFLRKEEDAPVIPDPMQDVLAAFFDAPIDQARRICGPLGDPILDSKVGDLESLARLELDYSS